jgi:tetratricopeptide (TPR) repeat protein
MILYRPVSLHELALMYESGMRAFPARLPQQPIFYPVLDLEYARQTAAGWNSRNGEFAGYVTQFKVDDEYIDKFEEHTVGESQYQEFWIPAEEVEEFNKHIVGHIKVVEAHFGQGFQGFVPEKFGLQGKQAVEQFSVLANLYLYKRMDFYLELKRNHKAVFLNYPFWQTFEFKNPGLKERVLQAIKEAWLTSFPQIPLPLPPAVQEDAAPVDPRRTIAQRIVRPVHEVFTPVEQPVSSPLVDPVDEESESAEETDAPSFVSPVREHIELSVPIKAQASTQPLPEDAPFVEPSDSHFVRGIKLGLSGETREAIGELSRSVKEEPDNAVAHTSLGVAFHRLGEDDRALACYETALKIDPIYAEAHYFRANLLFRRGNVREAIVGYTVAIGLKPELIEAHEAPSPEDRLTDYTGSPAEMYWIAKPAHRILYLNKSLESNPRQANLLKERAAQYYRLRNYAQAIADYSACLALRPGDARALHLRGVAYEQLGQPDRALEDYQRAISIQPQLWEEYINRGVSFGQSGNLRQAVASLTESIRLAPQNPDGYFNRGVISVQQGEFETAIEDFTRVIQLSPKDEGAYYWRGISREEAGRQREAAADYRQFLMLSRDPRARAEVERKLSQWHAVKKDRGSTRGATEDHRQKPDQVPAKGPDPLDVHNLIVALGERALNSTWFASGVNCTGEKAKELYAFTDQDKPIPGRELLGITAGIRKTIEGEFQAFEKGAASYWLLIRAWEGSGFYIETDDPETAQRLKARFPSAESVDGVPAPYEGLFIRI